MAEFPKAPVLFWVGCAASYDDRAKKIARATAKLMKAAGVEFAILGQEENCTGDPARRAGNEYLFATLAERNAATLNGYKEQGGVEADRHDLPALLQHAEERVPRLRRQVRGRAPHRLPPRPASPRRSSSRARRWRARSSSTTPATSAATTTSTSRRATSSRASRASQLVEAEGWNKQKGLCCGAGGAQMWMEEQNKDRMNVKRTLQLLQTEATDHRDRLPVLHDDAHRRPQGALQGRGGRASSTWRSSSRSRARSTSPSASAPPCRRTRPARRRPPAVAPEPPFDRRRGGPKTLPNPRDHNDKNPKKKQNLIKKK